MLFVAKIINSKSPAGKPAGPETSDVQSPMHIDIELVIIRRLENALVLVKGVEPANVQITDAVEVFPGLLTDRVPKRAYIDQLLELALALDRFRHRPTLTKLLCFDVCHKIASSVIKIAHIHYNTLYIILEEQF